jgi:ElaB/YqjD/DUF883 family membrane-anchored ribosome-binding protein
MTASEGPRPTEPPRDDPERLRREIEETRDELGATVQALADKADVKGQMAEKVQETKEAMRERVSGATPEPAQRAAAQVAEVAERRPPAAVAAVVALALLLLWLLGRR